jgi:hypothetical protein
MIDSHELGAVPAVMYSSSSTPHEVRVATIPSAVDGGTERTERSIVRTPRDVDVRISRYVWRVFVW